MKRKKSAQLFRLLHYTTILCGITLLATSCTIQRPSSLPSPEQPGGELIPAPAPPAAVYSPVLGPAQSLYHDAEKFLVAGNTRGAELSMERALRIEPQNGHYWYTMARIKYKQREYGQAVQFCLKSKSLAGRNQHLLTLNDDLILRARKYLD